MEVKSRVSKVKQVAIVHELDIVYEVFARSKNISFFSIFHFTENCNGVLFDLYTFDILSQYCSKLLHRLDIVIVLNSLQHTLCLVNKHIDEVIQ